MRVLASLITIDKALTDLCVPAPPKAQVVELRYSAV